MTHLGRDLRFAVRMLLSRPGHTGIAVLALGLGIALTTTMFSLVHGIFLRDLPFDDPHQLVRVECNNPTAGVESLQVSPRDFAAWRQQQSSFVELAAWRGFATTLTGGGRHAERLTISQVSPELFDLLRVRPTRGRGFSAEDTDVVMVSHKVWRDQLGADPEVLGRTLSFDGQPKTVVGVMPEGFHFPLSFDFWAPLRLEKSDDHDQRHFGVGVQVVGRLRDGVTRQAAQAEIDTLAARLAEHYPETNEGVGAQVQGYVEAYSDPAMKSGLLSLQIVVFAVLLVACANVANLFMARTVSRLRELAVRQALGASRGRLVVQLFVESLVLALAGGALGLFLTFFGTGVLNDLVKPQLQSFWVDIRVDPQVVFFVLVLSVGAGLLAGLVPALSASGTRMNDWLKDHAGGSSRGVGRASRFFTIAQIALSCSLLVVTGLVLKSFVLLAQTAQAIPADEMWNGNVYLMTRDEQRVARFAPELLQGLETRADVRGVGLLTSSVTQGVTLEQDQAGASSELPAGSAPAEWTTVSMGFFSAFEVTMFEGREFQSSDVADAEPVVVVSRNFATHHFGQESAIGQRIRSKDSQTWRRIVGVVSDAFSEGARTRRVWGSLPHIGKGGAAKYEEVIEAVGSVYVPLSQRPSRALTIAVWAWGEPLTLTTWVRDVVAAFDPSVPEAFVSTLEQRTASANWDYRLFGGLFMVFGGVAFFLAMVGLYGVMAFFVGQRKREFGIRMALGAQAADVIGYTLTKGLPSLAGGLALGLALALALARLLEVLLYQVEPWDGTVFAAGALAMVTSGLLACWVPARRATQVDPISVLRYE